MGFEAGAVSAAAKQTRTSELTSALEQRMGRTHARLRLGIEREHEAQIFGQGLNFFHIENWYSGHSLLRKALKVSGLYWAGHRNAARVVVRTNTIQDRKIPSDFDAFTILHLSDLHTELSDDALSRAAMLIRTLTYDICVITGDFRALTYGAHDATIRDTQVLCENIDKPIYAVLGNHDTVLMVPELERLGIHVLLNEMVRLKHGNSENHIFLAGVDDAHYFGADNLEKAAADIEPDAFAILLSHTPEIYRRAAHCGFDVMLSGHTHGGQICLPGGIAMKLNAVMPRRMGAGAWHYNDMKGYTSTGVGTSIVSVRFNCAPELTLHELRSKSPV